MLLNIVAKAERWVLGIQFESQGHQMPVSVKSMVGCNICDQEYRLENEKPKGAKSTK